MSKAKRPLSRSKLPDKNTTGKPRPVPPDVREHQDDDYTEVDFKDALDKTTRKDERAS